MDLDKYKCSPDDDSYKKCLKTKMGCTETPVTFIPVKNKNNFDISYYKGPLPIAIISMDGLYVYGYTHDPMVTGIMQLEPHKSNPIEHYLWSNMQTSRKMSYSDTMYKLNHRCVQLGCPPNELNTTVKFFEESRYILWLCIVSTKCIPMEQLINMEIEYMKRITGADPTILQRCKEEYHLPDATQECLSKWIEKMYKTNTLQGDTNGIFDNVGSQVKDMLN